MKTVAIIPARYGSSRFPGKPLTKIAGVTMIERVYRQASLAASLSAVIVATDDRRIWEAVRAFGGQAVMTRDDHPSGTDRLAEVVAELPDAEIIVNVQGDEPLIDPSSIDCAVQPLLDDRRLEMSTLASPLTKRQAIGSPDVVKVVMDRNGFALYFSRLPIPYYRNVPGNTGAHWAHIGLYVYRRDTLLRLSGLEPTAQETAECLEQLRALENGIRIRVVTGNFRCIAVDRPADVASVERALAGVAAP